MSNTTELIIRRPDDWHLHLRDGAMMEAVLPFTAQQFGRAIIMPNLENPVTTPAAAADYRRRILQALPDDGVGAGFLPLMTCYLTDEADPGQIEEGFLDGVFTAVKLYPANATTNSASGVTDPLALRGVFEVMQRLGMPLLIHGEVTDNDIDIFDREAVFIDRILTPLVTNFPELKIVLEHVTTKDAVDFVSAQPGRLAATITAHHLVINRNAIFEGGIRPHNYCLPIAKRERHRLALREAAVSGAPYFFLGTDSAPHAISAKEAVCGCAGIFTAPCAMGLYAQVFEEEDALDRLEGFASEFGPLFYGLEPNETSLTLRQDSPGLPETVSVRGGDPVRVFSAENPPSWSVAD